MGIDAYLQRIRYTGPRTPNVETLRALHRAHMLAVPFENLDIHLGRPIVLELPRLYDKIVNQRRGGFCYELNGSFAALLRELGFRVEMLSARVCDGGDPGPEFDHMALLVQLEERWPAGAATSRAEPSPREAARWLADVGFGDSFIEPLRLDDEGEQVQRGVAYRIEREGEIWRMLERQPGAQWMVMYQFTLQPRQLSDYAAMCRWQQTAPESHFTQKRICSLATPDRRVTLSDMKLIVTRDGEREERMLLNADTYTAVLSEYFGIILSSQTAPATRTTGSAPPSV